MRAKKSLKQYRALFHELYFKHTDRALKFRSVILIFDLIIIAFFIAAPFLRGSISFLVIDYAIAFVLALDLSARAWGYGNFWAWMRRPIAIVDVVVLVTLLFPVALANLGALRILRLWTLSHSDKLWETVNKGRWRNSQVEDIGKGIVNMIVFVFIMTAIVHSSFAGQHSELNSYIDSLYFTIMSLTTTGYGDIVLDGTWGRIVSILIMTGGVTLFVKLAQSILRPNKVVFPCPECGLQRHDPDAVFCKACSHKLNITNPGI